ncbi:MAG: small ribosomal subunit Rsm22 family protein [Myxococcaceae bacterium]
MGDPTRDLEQWIERLIAVWRRQRASKGGGRRSHEPMPDGTLTRDEIREVGAGVKQLSLGLTRERQLAGARYMDDPKLLGAYLLFYWPVSYAQARSTLSELPHRPKSALDLGSGPGPLAFAALDAGASTVVAADRSKPALELARALATEAGEGIAVREWSPERPLPDGTFDLITMGHVVNELYNGQIAPRAALLEKILERVNPRGSLVVIEPALRDTTRALLQVRDVLVGKGYAVRAPCLFRGPCPALIKESDWCHAERAWRMPKLVEELARAAQLHKDSLKMAYLVLAPKGEAWAEPPPGSLFRIVSEALEGKGRQRFMGCGPEGRVGLAMQEKHETEKNRLFFKVSRGDVIRITDTEERGDGRALTERSSVEIVAHAGKPVIQPA